MAVTATPSIHMLLRIPQHQQQLRCAHNQSSVGSISILRTSFGLQKRKDHRPFAAICASSTDLEDISTNAAPMESISVASTTTEAGEIKVKIDVSGAKSEAIFENVFSKMVTAAQPIPGFRRVKGGKTPTIPRDVLVQILGPSKVYKQVIKKIISSTVAEYVEKEKLNVTKDVRVEQSFEELEATFEAGGEFSFDAIIQLGQEDV